MSRVTRTHSAASVIDIVEAVFQPDQSDAI